MPYTEGRPRLKPPLETAGDISYSARRREELRDKLRQLLERQEHQAQLEARREEHEAEQWIRSHGATITAALKRTHPDHGGTARDFQMTQWARAVLSR